MKYFLSLLLSIVAVLVILAFLGVQPLASLKDQILDRNTSPVLPIAPPPIPREPKLDVTPVKPPVVVTKPDTTAIVTPETGSTEKRAPTVRKEYLYSLQDIEKAIMTKVNYVRTDNHMGAFGSTTVIYELAREHSMSMAENGMLTSRRFPNESPLNYMKEPGYFRAENITRCSLVSKDGSYFTLNLLADTIVISWMDDPGYKENILNAKCTHVGVGVAVVKSRGLCEISLD